MNELTEEEKIGLVRLLIGDIPTSPFYPLFCDDQLYDFLVLTDGNVFNAAKYAAISASMLLAGYSTRERTSQIEVWNSLASNYLKALEHFLNSRTNSIPNGLMPWGAGISASEMREMLCDPDRVRNKLIDVYLCNPPCSPEEIFGLTCK